ncbi:MAG: autoinducer binding domain-containing protein [Erythrobacter sp.]|nr:autoinducer binding domain-containing protein [Erythrobacter sp.]
MNHHFATLEAKTDISDAIDYACEVVSGQGAYRHSYHVTPVFEKPTSRATSIYARGFSAKWLELYDDYDFRRSDPIPIRVMQSGRLMTWAEAMEHGENSPENEVYFAAMREHDLIHGFGIPLFGLRGRDAYASFDFGRPIAEVADQQLGIVRAVAQAMHQRVCVLIENIPKTYVLSERETEVLQWIVQGKSLPVIAEILQIAPDTAKTYTKRIYAKLDASDRVSAVVKALKLGLVRI